MLQVAVVVWTENVGLEMEILLSPLTCSVYSAGKGEQFDEVAR